MEMMRRAIERTAAMAKNDPELAALFPRQEVKDALQDPALTYQQILATVLKGYGDRPAIGARAYDIVTDDETGDRVRHVLPAYKTISYGELATQVEAIANFWRHSEKHAVKPDDMVAFIAFNGVDMTAADLACIYAQAIVVPLQANYPAEHMREILADTGPVTLVCSIENLALSTEYALGQDSVRSLIVIGADERVDDERREIESARARLKEAGGRIALATFAEAVEEGSRFQFEPLPERPDGRDRLTMLMYTSGSTGTPKGAIIHEDILVSTWTSQRASTPAVSFVYAPMNHFMGRNALYSVLAQGGTAKFTQKSDLSTLLDDIRTARPTSLSLIPRICEMAHQHFLSEVNRLVAQGSDAATARQQVREAMSKTFLGDRAVFATVGSAPTTPELRQFMIDTFDMPVLDGYSCTETGGTGITFNNHIVEHSVVDYKLVDVPELGYYASDKPFPRGELLVKTHQMIKGYYKRPDATAAIFDENGFLKTGDIVELRGNGQMFWLDRRNNVTKLAQGEFVAIGPLESVYLTHAETIRQVYIYGSAQRSFLLAVVVPDMDVVRARLGHEPGDQELHELVLEDMRRAAGEAGLRSFEVPRDVLIEREPFSLGNGLLSAVGKPLRANLKLHYGETLEAMYRDMETKQAAELDTLREAAKGQSTQQRVASALKLSLGLTELATDSPKNFRELGGDSLGAVNFGLLLEEMFDVPVPVSDILHPDANIAHIAGLIDRLLADTLSAARYGEIHPDAETVHASELTLDRLLDAQVLSSAETAPAADEPARTILLTGANGFLGRFLCIEWLEEAARRDGKVICMLRGRDEASARKRLDDAIGTWDAELAERFRSLADRHLEVVPADLAAPRLGLDEDTFARLATEVDQIVHVAALVNHKLAYRSLFEPNVLGTAELIRLALTARRKRFDYVSSIAVAHVNRELSNAPENVDVRVLASDVAIAGDRYALGYTTSKWAGEVLLRDAHERFGLPVNVFRADMILPHERYKGQINTPDSFTRQLASVIMTGLAPKSFYRLDVEGRRQDAHYDGLPVNFVAAAMKQISALARPGFHTFNLVNMHYDDGISLDTMVDWIIETGHEVVRIDDHDEWFHRFTEKLRNLPDEQRQHSCLAIAGNLSAPFHAEPMPIAHAEFLAALGETALGSKVPHLTRDYLRKCVADMEILGLIPEPALTPA
jgi:fatty acid CoA ligase FadD9